MTTFNNAYDEELKLTEEQEKCLNYHFLDKTLVVKGYAGAGKSVVIQTTALKYINMYPEGKREHKIAIFTFTNALITTTRELLDANVGGRDIYTSTLDHYLMDVYKAMGGPYKKMYYGEIRRGNIRQALQMHESKYGHHRFHELDETFWEEEIDWMKGMNVTIDDMDYYLSIPRRGRGTGVRMSYSDRVTAFQIFTFYCQVNDKKGCGDWSDYAIYINKRLKEYKEAKASGRDVVNPIPEELLFDLIFVDEAQDLSLAQMLAVMGLQKKAIIIAMDAHQRIYAANWTGKQLGIETQTQWLKKSMRNTVEIDALAESLRAHNDDIVKDNERRAIPIRHGDKPVIVAVNELAEEKSFVIKQIQTWLSESDKIRVAIITATNKQVERYSAWLSEQEIYHEIICKDSTFSMKTPGVKLLNAYNAKGLEFFRVIIPEFNEGYFPFRIKATDQEEIDTVLAQFRSLAYVAMTRAQETLCITYHGNKPSRFIAEMDEELYERKGTVRKTSSSARPASSYQKSTKSYSKTGSTGTVGRTVPQTVNVPSRGCDTSDFDVNEGLLKFFETKGFECIDKRQYEGGSLWVVGSKEELIPVVNEARKLFGDLGNSNYAPNGGKATKKRPAWFMTAKK